MPLPEPEQHTMSFGDHLEELRRRLIHALVGVVAAVLITIWYGRAIVSWLFEPLFVVERHFGLPTQTYTRSAVSGFTVYFKVSLVAAIVLASPWIFYQLWLFIRTGLYSSERRVFHFLAPLSALMTALGVLFMYYLFLPAALTFLIYFTTTYPPPSPPRHSTLQHVTDWFDWANKKTFEIFIPGHVKPGTTPSQTQPATQPVNTTPVTVPVFDENPPQPAEGQLWFDRDSGELRLYDGGNIRVVPLTVAATMIPLIDPDDYIGEVLLLTLVIVAVFHVPVVMALLAATGLLDPAVVRRYRKVFVFACFVIAIFITPNQDLFSNVALPLLMWLLFEVGLLLMSVAWKRRQEQAKGE